jgi:hypothetical protein
MERLPETSEATRQLSAAIHCFHSPTYPILLELDLASIQEACSLFVLVESIRHEQPRHSAP